MGQLANGINLSNNSHHSVATTYAQQRIIAIPPHGNKNLTEEKWIKNKTKPIRIEMAETFQNRFDHNDYGIKEGQITKGEVIVFKEGESSWKREYIITYSTEEDFHTFSSIKTALYLHEAIGVSESYGYDEDKNDNKTIDELNTYTITGFYHIQR